MNHHPQQPGHDCAIPGKTAQQLEPETLAKVAVGLCLHCFARDLLLLILQHDLSLAERASRCFTMKLT